MYASQWLVGWIELAWDISGVEETAAYLLELVNEFEDLIHLSVSAPPFPPPFDDSLVISENAEVSPLRACISDTECHKEKANYFCPANIPSLCLPAWNEPPCSPLLSKHDPNANL
jgi:hypothetical protein